MDKQFPKCELDIENSPYEHNEKDHGKTSLRRFYLAVTDRDNISIKLNMHPYLEDNLDEKEYGCTSWHSWFNGNDIVVHITDDRSSDLHQHALDWIAKDNGKIIQLDTMSDTQLDDIKKLAILQLIETAQQEYLKQKQQRVAGRDYVILDQRPLPECTVKVSGEAGARYSKKKYLCLIAEVNNNDTIYIDRLYAFHNRYYEDTEKPVTRKTPAKGRSCYEWYDWVDHDTDALVGHYKDSRDEDRSVIMWIDEQHPISETDKAIVDMVHEWEELQRQFVRETTEEAEFGRE